MKASEMVRLNRSTSAFCFGERGSLWKCVMPSLVTKNIDRLLDPIYPHFYVVATGDSVFGCTEKRMKKLAEYDIH